MPHACPLTSPHRVKCVAIEPLQGNYSVALSRSSLTTLHHPLIHPCRALTLFFVAPHLLYIALYCITVDY